MKYNSRLLSNQSRLLSSKYSVRILSWSSAGLAAAGTVCLGIFFFYAPVHPDMAAAARENAPISSGSVVLTSKGISPASVGVARGSQVVWTNNSNSSITVSSSNSVGPNSVDALEPGDTYTYYASTAGTFKYKANGAAGTVVVK